MQGRISTLWLLALAYLSGCRTSPRHSNTPPTAASSASAASQPEEGNGRSSASTVATVSAQEPSILALQKAIGMEVVGSRLAVWNGEFVAEGDVTEGTVGWRQTDLVRIGTIAVHLAKDGTKAQWVRVEHADEQTFWGEDKLVFYGGMHAPNVAWAPGGSFSDVLFVEGGALVIHKDRVFKVSASGHAMELKTGLSKPRRVVRAGGNDFIVCEPSKVRTPSFNGTFDEGGVGACASSRGWKLELDWNEFPPMACEERLITFVKGKNGSRQQWTRIQSRRLDDGALVSERAGRGAEVVCVGAAVVEASGPGVWDVLSLQPVPRPLCGGERAVLWSSPDQQWCISETGKLWPASGVGVAPEAVKSPTHTGGTARTLREERP